MKAGPQINFDGVVLERFKKKPLAHVSVTLVDLGGAARRSPTTDGHFAFTRRPARQAQDRARAPQAHHRDDRGDDRGRQAPHGQVPRRGEGGGRRRRRSSCARRASRRRRSRPASAPRRRGASPARRGTRSRSCRTSPASPARRSARATLIVWGSAPNETRVNVDGVEIPTLYHVGGLRSTINSDLVRSINLSPGSYGADYGRGLGGLVRIDLGLAPQGGGARLRRRRRDRHLGAGLDGDHAPAAAGGRRSHQLPRPAAARSSPRRTSATSSPSRATTTTRRAPRCPCARTRSWR